jgi:hypothetical protein
MKKLALVALVVCSTAYANENGVVDITGGRFIPNKSLYTIDTSPEAGDRVIFQPRNDKDYLNGSIVWKDTIVICEKYSPEPKHKKGEVFFSISECLKEKKVSSSDYGNGNSIKLGADCKVYATPENSVYVSCKDGTRVDIASLSLTYKDLCKRDGCK